MKTVVVDRREPELIVRQLKKFGCKTVKRDMKLADYEVGGCLVERKKANDFESSVIDGRLFDQMNRMMDSGYKCFLIVTGRMNPQRLKLTSYLGALASVYVRYGVAVMMFDSDKQMSYFIAKVLDKVASGIVGEKRRVVKRRPQNKVQKLALFLGVPDSVARKLVKRYGSVERLCSVDVDELKRVRGIGTARAKKICRMLQSQLD